jgi:pimeloyl-ACP methyl ester carboxylesterase
MRKFLIGIAALFGVVVVVLAAGYFALRRPDIPFQTLDAKYANAQSKWLDMGDGVRLHYRDQGNPNGHVLILVHGFSASLHTWEPWVQRLGSRYRILTLDLPGHGLTETPPDYHASTDGFVDIVHRFAEKMNAPRFTLAGNSMGGGVAWNYALAHPEQLDALVLVDAAGWPERGDNPPLIFALINNPALKPIIRDLDTKPMIQGGLQKSFGDPAFADAAMVERYYELSRAPGHRAILLNIERSGPATPERMAQIHVPTLVLHGEKDNLIPVSSGRRFAETIPGAEIVTFANIGHVPMEEAADQSAAALAAFLTRVYATAPEATHEETTH